MKLYKAFKYALNMVLHAKMRSWLTILGIVIGVAAVIAIIAMGDALQQDMNAQLNTLGGDLLTLRAGGSRASGFGGGGGFGEGGSGGGTATLTTKVIQLDNKDVQTLRASSDIKLFDTEISGRADVYNVAEKGTISITGVDPNTWAQVTTVTLSDGRFLGPSDTNVIVIGGKLANGYFKKPVGINQMLTVGNKLFRVVGITHDQSSSIYMPIDNAYEVITDKTKDVYDIIIIKVKNQDDVDVAMANIQQKLMNARHNANGKADFQISSNKDRQAQRAAMVATLTAFLTAIAAVALLVGAVGVANTMFTSVLEKTKEIGIMKAIGARNFDILSIFLLNAGLIGLIGGLIGVIFGVLLSGILPSLMGTTGGMFRGLTGGVLSMQVLLYALGGSLLIGMVAGAIPAYQASKLKPVDALRYE